MKKSGIVQTILVFIGVYLLADLVLFKGFLYNFLDTFFASMKVQGKMGLVVVFIGLAIAVFGLLSAILGMYGRTLVGKVAPERLTTHRILSAVLGIFLVIAGAWLAYYGLTVNQ